jgi:hypothetical protein
VPTSEDAWELLPSESPRPRLSSLVRVAALLHHSQPSHLFCIAPCNDARRLTITHSSLSNARVRPRVERSLRSPRCFAINSHSRLPRFQRRGLIIPGEWHRAQESQYVASEPTGSVPGGSRERCGINVLDVCPTTCHSLPPARKDLGMKGSRLAVSAIDVSHRRWVFTSSPCQPSPFIKFGSTCRRVSSPRWKRS